MKAKKKRDIPGEVYDPVILLTEPAQPVRFLPSYVGSKLHWVPRLQHLEGRPMVELFAGSAVLTANLASSALLVELDPHLAKILSQFDEQIVPDVFTREDYFRVRSQDDWWRYAFCLQAMSFSGVFRYSKNGYNVPHKGGGRAGEPGRSPAHESMQLRPRYEAALARWRELEPTVIHGSFFDITDEQIAAVGADPVVVLDPPYQGSQASYNVGFDYAAYWARVGELAKNFELLIFDTVSNLVTAGYPYTETRKMRVNGGRPGDLEAIAQLRNRREPRT